MPKFVSTIQANKIPILGIVPESSGTAPTSPVIGQLWTDTSVTPKVVRVYDGSAWAPLNTYAGTTAGTFAAGNDSRITGAEQTANKAAANGYASLDAGTKVPIAQLPTGTTATTVVIGNDARVTGAEQTANKGAASGYAGLDATSRLATANLPTVIPAAGITGATAASRYVGATASGAPATGTFAIGDFVIAQNGAVYVCTAAGTPGTWSQVGAVQSVSAGTGITVNQTTGAVTVTNNGVTSAIAGSNISVSGTNAITFNVVNSPTFSGVTTGQALVASGLTGATAASRYVGATAAGAPATGTFAVGDTVIDQSGNVWVCTVAGTPGTWLAVFRLGTTATTAAAGNDSRITGAEQTANKGAANGYASLDGTTKVPFAQLPTAASGASTASTVVIATDTRLSDTRTPTTGSVVDASVSGTAAIAESKLALATDAAAGTGSRRTLGYTGLSAMPGIARLDQIAVPTANVSMNGYKITGLAAPTVASDAARLADVQAATAGIDAMPSVRAASTANVALTGTQTIDGVVLVAGDRVLLKNQTTTTENGSYIVAAGAWARTTDAISSASFWFVEEGTTNDNTQWMVATNGAITLGTTPLSIVQFGAALIYTGTTNRITVTGQAIDIAATFVGQTSITTLGTIATGTWNGTAIGILYGGTGATTAAAARTNLGVPQFGYATTLGAVTAGTPYTVTHGLNTQDVIAQVRDASTNEYLYADIINASTTTVTVTTGLSYAASALRIVVLPVA